MRSILLVAGFLMIGGLLISQPVMAQNRVWLGQARLFTNDMLGDGKDRWRTGSYSISKIRGTRWDGTLPGGFGQLVEYRIRSEIIAPSNLQNPVIGTDRPYVGALTFGARSYMSLGGADMSLGLDLVVVGPQTGLGAFQSQLHAAIGMGTLKVLGSQIGNAVYPTLNMEIGRDIAVSGHRRRILIRPFLEAQIGVETFLRLGGDITFGNAGSGDFQVRDVTTGYRNIAIKNQDRQRGLSFLLGGDIAYVQSSKYLPAASGYTLQNPRIRLRAGFYHEGERGSVFYGLTWLGKEFVNQKAAGQVVGAMTVRVAF